MAHWMPLLPTVSSRVPRAHAIPALPAPSHCHSNPLKQPMQDVIQTGVSAADRTMKAQLVGELRTMLTHKVGGQRLQVALSGTWLC